MLVKTPSVVSVKASTFNYLTQTLGIFLDHYEEVAGVSSLWPWKLRLPGHTQEELCSNSDFHWVVGGCNSFLYNTNYNFLQSCRCYQLASSDPRKQASKLWVLGTRASLFILPRRLAPCWQAGTLSWSRGLQCPAHTFPRADKRTTGHVPHLANYLQMFPLNIFSHMKLVGLLSFIQFITFP